MRPTPSSGGYPRNAPVASKENGELKVKKDWEIKKLGEVCEIYQPQTISTKQLIENGKYSVYGANGIIGNYDKYNHEESEVLLTCRGATCGSVNISEPFSWINGNAMVIHPKSTDISKQFLTFILCSLDYSHIITGAAQPQITRQTLSPTLIPVPPLEEQKRIVKILDEKFAQLESLKANAQTNLQNAKDLFQSQLTKAFSNTTWEKKRLGDCGTLKNGMNFAATDSGYTIRSLGVGDFKDRYSIDDTETLSEISLKAAPSEDYLLHDGDIVFVRSNGNKELVGRCLLVYPKNVPTTYSGFCIRFRKNFDLLDADFLLHFMKAESSRKILNGKEGANISNLKKILGDFELPLPSLPEQKRIVKELDTLSEKVRQLQEIYTKQIANCDELKQAYLQKAFEGEL